jgi:hypothetical protein
MMLPSIEVQGVKLIDATLISLRRLFAAIVLTLPRQLKGIGDETIAGETAGTTGANQSRSSAARA